MRLKSLKITVLLVVSGLVIGSNLVISSLVTHSYRKSLLESLTAQAEHWALMVGLEVTDKILINDLVALKPYRQQVNQLWFQMTAITFVVLLLAYAISLFFIKRLTRPLTTLAAVAEKIDEGNLDERVETKGTDEVSKLAFSFNRMVERIK